jgi:hypothetical protein
MARERLEERTVDHRAISLVTEAMRQRIEDLIYPKTVFVGPLDADDAINHSINLFLYRLGINADLRSAPHVTVEGGLPLDLYFLVTPRTQSERHHDVGVQTFEGLEALGLIIRSFNDRPDLTGGAVMRETVRLSIDPVPSEEMGRIWTLFPTANYRTSVIYIASPVWIDPALPAVTGGPVIAEPHRVGPFAA